MGAVRAASRNHQVRSTRDLILDVAERHFAERGFAGVAMRAIAIEAGLKNQASLYYHFRDKRSLYETVLARGLAPIVALLEESGKAAAGDETAGGARRPVVDATIDRLIDYLAKHPHLPRLIQRAGLDDARYLPSVIPQLLFPFYAQGLNALAGTDARWQATDLPHVAVGIYHLIFGYFANAGLLEVLLQADPKSPAAVERQRRFVKAAVAQLMGIASSG